MGIMEETNGMTEEKANALFDEWVNRLGLKHWDIHFQWKVRGRDMALENSAGCTEWIFTSRQATVQILDRLDYPESSFPFDYEQTLVHELLHLKFSALDETGDGLRDKLTHQMIDDMARALVSAKRGNEH